MEKNTITYESFFNIISNKFNEEEIKQIKRAYEFAEKHHLGKKRKTGDDYITHPLNVAYILLELNVDYITIISALIHETVNNGDATFEEIEENFGKEITNIVKIISKINKMNYNEDTESNNLYFRKIVVGLAEDVRVLFIKLADRLHNMRTVWALTPEKQKQRATETMNVLIPIAHRLGINAIKSELEDLCLKYLKPEVYDSIIEKLDESREHMNKVLQEMQQNICDILLENDIKFQIKSRVKSIHSIYNKLQNGKKFSDIYDILALRVILDKVSDCYLAVGLIHAKYRPMPKRFKDYISMPKENMYQSLHTTVFGIDGYLFEIQLRTHEMNEIAEHGIASHWSYKEHGSVKIQNMMEQKLEFFRNIIDSKEEMDHDIEESINQELLKQQIYVFTPKGDIIELPKGATPIDFAYKIHSKVGDTTIGAIVNDKIVPLSEPLNDGDIVKIQTNKNSIPKNEWLKFVKTSQAKNKIKAYFSKQDRIIYENKGKELLEKELRKRHIAFNDIFNQENINKLLALTKVHEIEDIYFGIGSLRYTSAYIINLIIEHESSKENLTNKLINNHTDFNEDYNSDIIVEGIGDIKVNLANCCKPIKGDDIIGYVTKGNGISIHKSDCYNINNIKDRIIDVYWNEWVLKEHWTDIIIGTRSSDNPLLEIVKVTSSLKINVINVKSFKTDGFDNYNLSIKVKNIQELNNLIKELNKINFIKNVRRGN